MKILIDNQVYENQRFGGISRYFNELQYGNESLKRMQVYQSQSSEKNTFFRQLRRRLKVDKVETVSNHSNHYDFYKAQLQDLQYDVFHPTYYDNYFLEVLEKPFVLTVHDMIHEKYPEYFGLSPDSINKRRLCEKAEKIIAVSETTKRDIIEIFGTSKDKIHVIYHATNFNTIITSKPTFHFKEKNFVLFTGNRNAYKNFLTFLLAIEPILKRKKLLLICTGPAFSKQEQKWIKDLELKEHVCHHYCQSDTELAYLYKNAECFIFPSLYEGFGLPILEAFACGCPVVSSDGGSLKEIGRDAAVYFDPKNILQMRQAVTDILSNDSLRKEIIFNGHERIKDFSWNKCRKETQEVYHKVVER